MPTDHREPPYDSLSPSDRAALDEWRALQIPGEVELFHRFLREFREHGEWAKASRASLHFTAEDLAAFSEEYMALLSKYGYQRADAPPEARPLHLRMFYLPEEENREGDREADGED